MTRAAASSVSVSIASSSSVDDAGDLGVGVRVVGRPHDAVGTDVLAVRGVRERFLVGVEADVALALEDLGRRRRLVAAAEHLDVVVEALEHRRAPAAGALEEHHRQLGKRSQMPPATNHPIASITSSALPSP